MTVNRDRRSTYRRFRRSNFILGDRRAYSRDDGTAGWDALEEIVGGLEGGSAVAFSSGMAAIASVFETVPHGSIVALPDDCYQGVAGLANAGAKRGRWTVRRRHTRELSGATPGALETFLAVRGVRTLAVRLDRAQHNAAILAERLEKHPKVALTRFPGLASHPTFEAAKRQLKGFGTIISFDVRGGATAADSVCAKLQLHRGG